MKFCIIIGKSNKKRAKLHTGSVKNMKKGVFFGSGGRKLRFKGRKCRGGQVWGVRFLVDFGPREFFSVFFKFFAFAA